MNMYTPYRDKMCVICGEKPYIAANIHSEWCCEDCLDLTNDAPITGTISKVELTYDTIFLGKDNKPMLTLAHDGKIIVDGEPNETAKTFLEVLEREYGSLPQKLKEANEKIRRLQAENKSVTDYCVSILDCDLCQCGKCAFCEAKEFIAQLKDL